MVPIRTRPYSASCEEPSTVSAGRSATISRCRPAAAEDAVSTRAPVTSGPPSSASPPARSSPARTLTSATRAPSSGATTRPKATGAWSEESHATSTVGRVTAANVRLRGMTGHHPPGVNRSPALDDASSPEAGRTWATIPEPPTDAPAGTEPLVVRLERAVRRFRLQSAHNLLDEAFAAHPPELLVRDVGRPLLDRLDDPAATRFATSLLELRLLAYARGWERVNGPVVVLACAPSEERVLDLIALGIALAERRCRIAYLGAATPVEALTETAAAQQATLVVLHADRALTRPEIAAAEGPAVPAGDGRRRRAGPRQAPRRDRTGPRKTAPPPPASRDWPGGSHPAGATKRHPPEPHHEYTGR